MVSRSSTNGRTAGLPELIVVGCPVPIAHMLLMDTFARLQTAKAEGWDLPEDGDILSGLGDGEGMKLEFIFKTVGPGNLMNLWCQNFYRGQEVETLQIIYPDRNGLYPWQPGFDQTMQQDVAYAKKSHLSLVE